MRTSCELIVEPRPKGTQTRIAAQKPTGLSPQVGLIVPAEVIMRGETFPMPPLAPERLVR